MDENGAARGPDVEAGSQLQSAELERDWAARRLELSRGLDTSIQQAISGILNAAAETRQGMEAEAKLILDRLRHERSRLIEDIRDYRRQREGLAAEIAETRRRAEEDAGRIRRAAETERSQMLAGAETRRTELMAEIQRLEEQLADVSSGIQSLLQEQIGRVRGDLGGGGRTRPAGRGTESTAPPARPGPDPAAVAQAGLASVGTAASATTRPAPEAGGVGAAGGPARGTATAGGPAGAAAGGGPGGGPERSAGDAAAAGGSGPRGEAADRGGTARVGGDTRGVDASGPGGARGGDLGSRAADAGARDTDAGSRGSAAADRGADTAAPAETTGRGRRGGREAAAADAFAAGAEPGGARAVPADRAGADAGVEYVRAPEGVGAGGVPPASLGASEGAAPPGSVEPGSIAATAAGAEPPGGRGGRRAPEPAIGGPGAVADVPPSPPTAPAPPPPTGATGYTPSGAATEPSPATLGRVEVAVTNTPSFARALEFQRGVQRTEGVRQVQALQFEHGTLVLAVEHDPGMDIAAAVAAIPNLGLELVRRTADRLEFSFPDA